MFISYLAILIYLILLLFALFMVINFYVCESYTCKIFNDCKKLYKKGTKKYAIELIKRISGDGMWAFPYIGGTIISLLSVWLLKGKLTLVNFTIIFLASFLTIYGIFSFFNHHYLKPIKEYLENYIDENCINNINNNTIP